MWVGANFMSALSKRLNAELYDIICIRSVYTCDFIHTTVTWDIISECTEYGVISFALIAFLWEYLTIVFSKG